MQVYTVHRAKRGATPEAVEFVPDGFSYGAFVFGPFWLAYRRLWLVLAIVLMAIAIITGIEYAAGLNPAIGGALSLLTGLFLGLEGNQLVRWTLERNGRPALAVVTGKNLDEAEFRYFSEIGGTPSGTSYPAGLPRTAISGDAGGGPVLGLFPSPGGRA
ncbi:MAG: DUF2628 domain-containing protein [Proteobacteria bacterium]|nr:DUF2628 domain-containing protein [Pseudomonadota bacterium]